MSASWLLLITHEFSKTLRPKLWSEDDVDLFIISFVMMWLCGLL